MDAEHHITPSVSTEPLTNNHEFNAANPLQKNSIDEKIEATDIMSSESSNSKQIVSDVTLSNSMPVDPKLMEINGPSSVSLEQNGGEMNGPSSEVMSVDQIQNEMNEVSSKSADPKQKVHDDHPRYRADSSDSESSSSSELSSSSEDESSEADNASVISCCSDKPQAIPKLKTDGELLLEDLPPIENLEISVPEDKCSVIGYIHNTVETLVLVKAIEDLPPVDIDSVLFLDKGECALGQVFDVIGPVKEPIYCIRFNSKEHINEMYFNIGDPVYYTPTLEYTQYVFLPDLLKAKGSDASWMNGNEPPEDKIDYSDDEQEREAKRRARLQRSKRDGPNIDDDQNSEECSSNHYSETSSDRNSSNKRETLKRKSTSSSSENSMVHQSETNTTTAINHRDRFTNSPSYQSNHSSPTLKHVNRWKHVNVFQRTTTNAPNSPSSSSNHQPCFNSMPHSQSESSPHPSLSSHFSSSDEVNNGSHPSPFCVRPPIFQPPPPSTLQHLGSPFPGPMNGGFPQFQPPPSLLPSHANQCNTLVASPAIVPPCSSCSCNRGFSLNQIPTNHGPPSFFHAQQGLTLPNMNPSSFPVPPPVFHPSSSLGLTSLPSSVHQPTLSFGRSLACQSTPSYGGPPIFHSTVTDSGHSAMSRTNPGLLASTSQPNMSLFQTPTSNGGSCIFPPSTSNGGPNNFQSPPPFTGHPMTPQSMFSTSHQNLRPPMN